MNPYANPNIAHYSGKNELETERKVFHCAALMRAYVKGDVLECGAGQGHLTDALTKHNAAVRSVLCIDYSDYNKDFLLKKGYAFKKVDLDKHPYLQKAEAFDTIISCDVIEHLLSPYLHLIECFRLLRKGGWMVLSTPQASKSRITVPHINYFSPESIELCLKRAGFRRVVRIYNGVLSPLLTRITSRIPGIRSILNQGCYFVAQK
jgi:2-polyprenyl-3-methyl-5-hydroxy-6-metoxy-1,4-benzoquinol methylase